MSHEEMLTLRYEDFMKKHAIAAEIEKRKYYEGFGVRKEKEMFEEELKDIEGAYRSSLKDIHKKVDDTLPLLLFYMEEFVCLHKANEEVNGKLVAFLEKMARKQENKDEGKKDEW